MLYIDVYDEVSLTEVVWSGASGHTHEIDVYESLLVNESILYNHVVLDPLHLFASAFDSIVVSESVEGSWQLNGSAYESVTVSDVITAYLGMAISVYDEATVSEYVAGVAGALGISVNDTVSVVDVGKLLGFIRGYIYMTAVASLPSITAVGSKPSLDAVGKKASIIIGQTKPAVLRASVFDGVSISENNSLFFDLWNGLASDEVSISESVNVEILTPTETEYQITSGGYDSTFWSSGIYSGTEQARDFDRIFAGNFSGSDGNTVLLFTNVAVTQGSSIISAIVQLRSYSINSSVDINLSIDASDVDNASFPVDYAAFDALVFTGEASNWVETGSWAANEWIDSEDITAVIQAIVDRPGWVSGNDLLIVISPTGSQTENEYVQWHSYDGFADSGAKLVINYA